MAYRVKKGDTPNKIAAALGVSLAEIMAIESAFSTPGDARTLQIGAMIDLEGTAATDAPKTDFTDDEDTRFNGLPGQPELWKIDGEAYIVFYVPDSEPPIPLLFSVPNEDDLKSFFGDKSVEYDKTVTMEQAQGTGAIVFGSTDTIPAEDGDPWAGFVERMDRAKEVQPWLSDPEVFAVVSGAWLEGRDPEQWEFEATDWWQTHNEAQREWMWISMRDPTEALKVGDDNYTLVYEQFRAIGLEDVNEGLLRYMADQFTQGNWSQQYLQEQIAGITGDTSSVPTDAGLSKYMADQSIKLGDPSVGRNTVRDSFNRWLGPAFPPSDAQLDEWAAKFRRDPQAAQDSLTIYLRGQRMALYPEYDNPDLTYEDMAAPWRGFSANIWGQQIDETDPMFQQIVRLNDSAEAGKLLRKEGLKQNIGTVRQSAVKGLSTQLDQARVTI